MEIAADFEAHPNTLDVAQDHLLPRSEAVDAILMRHCSDIRNCMSELADIRRDMGMAGKPFIVRAA